MILKRVQDDMVQHDKGKEERMTINDAEASPCTPKIVGSVL